MHPASNTAFIVTAPERCRMCYTCVRECPAKAIRITDGQADVLPHRCIACGNCVKVCSQDAKQTLSSRSALDLLLGGQQPVAACIAPSFPAEFTELEAEELVGMLRALGFSQVTEVAFGADLVATAYKELRDKHPNERFIASTCPAVIGYVERYLPELTERLAPIVSPMIAMARCLRSIHGAALRCVFIGPCIAKKAEAIGDAVKGDIDCVITFSELRQAFIDHGISLATSTPSPFDPPQAGTGALFPVSRGMLQAAGIAEDLLAGEVVATEGRRNMVEALREFADGMLEARLLELLCCEGCVMGPGIDNPAPIFNRRDAVSRHVRRTMRCFDQEAWKAQTHKLSHIDLSRSYTPDDQRIPEPQGQEIDDILLRMGKCSSHDELNCGACGYENCREHALAIYKGLAESEMCLPYMIDRLSETVDELEDSHRTLANTQEQLMHSEKLASMGQLAAGIAHEVNNPLGVVLMYAHLLLDECEKASPMAKDLGMIVEQADRCKKIVGGLLNFARQNKVIRQRCKILDIVERSLRSVPCPDGIAVKKRFHLRDDWADLDSDQLVQALTNLISNAHAAMTSDRGASGELTVIVEDTPDTLTIRIKDSGTGIPEEHRKRIFDPFFTTKQIGIGTGLGLAVVYGIVKMHQGEIRVDSNADPEQGPTGTMFSLTLQRHEEQP